MRILVDAMGGDLAPDEIVKGAVHAQQELGAEIVLVGQRAAIEACLRNEQAKLEIIDASEVITMDDDPSTATRRKKDASMTVALNMLRDGKGDAVVSAGSTGALLTGATLIVKRIHGIRRAALAPVLPNGDAGVMLIDCGANADCTPEYLLQFAYMGSYYARTMLGIAAPRVGMRRSRCSRRRTPPAASALSAMWRRRRCSAAMWTLLSRTASPATCCSRASRAASST